MAERDVVVASIVASGLSVVLTGPKTVEQSGDCSGVSDYHANLYAKGASVL